MGGGGCHTTKQASTCRCGRMLSGDNLTSFWCAIKCAHVLWRDLTKGSNHCMVNCSRVCGERTFLDDRAPKNLLNGW